MESCATPKMVKAKSAQEKGTTAQRKRCYTSPVGTSLKSIQEPISAAATSRPSEDTVQEHDEDVELQERDVDVVDSEVVIERLRKRTSVELERDNRKERYLR